MLSREELECGGLGGGSGRWAKGDLVGGQRLERGERFSGVRQGPR